MRIPKDELEVIETSYELEREEKSGWVKFTGSGGRVYREAKDLVSRIETTIPGVAGELLSKARGAIVAVLKLADMDRDEAILAYRKLLSAAEGVRKPRTDEPPCEPSTTTIDSARKRLFGG